MAVATFDTLKFANTLKAAGVPVKQAEAQASAFSEALQTNFKDLVTKDDLKKELNELELHLTAVINSLKSDITLLRWMVGTVGFGILAIVIRLFIFRTPL